MAREILFRGKVRTESTTVGSDWIEGYYTAGLTTRSNSAYIVDKENRIQYPVYANTVGQFTGLTDQNGKKIFEGDIVKDVETDIDENVFEIVFDEYCRFMAKTGVTTYLLAINNDDYVVIGNIHDNPEMLKEGAE